MNVALPALIVFFLLLPGFMFRARLKRAERTSLDYSPFGRVVAEALIWAILLHLVWLASAYWFGYRLDSAVVLGLLGSSPTAQAKAVERVATEFATIAFYFLTMLCASYVVPLLARTLIETYRLDRSGYSFSALFRFHDAPWYYLLTDADFSKKEEPDFIVISAIIDVSGAPVLYMGVLDEFFVDSEGNLDRMILQRVARRSISSHKLSTPDDESTACFYQIEGDYFVLRYSETITLNVEYVRLTELTKQPLVGSEREPRKGSG